MSSSSFAAATSSSAASTRAHTRRLLSLAEGRGLHWFTSQLKLSRVWHTKNTLHTLYIP
jgi:hypothetical protein